MEQIKVMDLVVWLGANHSDARRHRADLQRRQAAKDALLCFIECETLHSTAAGDSRVATLPCFIGVDELAKNLGAFSALKRQRDQM